MVPLTERGRSATGAVVDEYYRRYNAGDFGRIRGSMPTAGARDASSDDTFRAAFGRLGRYNGGARKSFKLLDLKGNRWYYRFDASYEKGPARDSFVLVKEGTGYKLENLPNTYFPCLGRR